MAERPTPIPAPNCFDVSPAANTTKDVITSISPTSADSIAVSVYSPPISRTNLYLSEDGGVSWTLARTFNDFVSKIVPSPAFARDRIIFAVGSNGIYRSLNAGLSWASITPSSWVTRTPMVRQFGVSPAFASDRTFLLGSRAAPRGVVGTVDGGETWSYWLVDAVDALFFSPNYSFDRTVWVARNDEQTFRRDVMLTTNRGESWEFVHVSTAQPLGISPAYSQDSTIIWHDFIGGLYVSRNSDKIFPLLEKAEAEVLKRWQFSAQSGWAPAGEQRVGDLVFSPQFGQDRSAFALSDDVMLVTRDGGASWSPLCYWGYNPEKPESLRFDHLAISSNFPNDRTLLAGGAGARLAVSHDGGHTWTLITLR